MIQGSRKSRILSGISANIFGQIVTVGVQLAGVPLLLHFWGVQYYGEWLLLFSLPAYLGMSDLGLGTVAITEISLCIVRQDYERANTVFRGAFFSVVSVGILACTVFSVSILLLPYRNWLNLQQITQTELKIAMLLLTSYIFFAIFLTLLLGAYRTFGNYARGQVISNSFRILEFSTLLIVVAMGGRVVAAATAFVVIRMLYTGFVWFDLRKRAKWLHLKKFDWEWTVIKPLLPPSLSMMTVYMGQTLVSQGLVTMIGITLGAANVVLFTTVRTLCNFSKQIVGAINMSVFSEYAISLGKKDIDAARRLHVKSVQVNIILTFLVVIGVKLVGPFVLDIWTKGKIAAQEPFFTLYLCYLLINSFWLGSWNMLIGSNQHQSIAVVYLWTSLAVMTIVYLGVDRIGICLVPVALMLSDTVFFFVVLRKSLNVLQQPIPDFIRNAIRMPDFR